MDRPPSPMVGESRRGHHPAAPGVPRGRGQSWAPQAAPECRGPRAARSAEVVPGGHRPAGTHGWRWSVTATDSERPQGMQSGAPVTVRASGHLLMAVLAGAMGRLARGCSCAGARHVSSGALRAPVRGAPRATRGA